MKTAAFKNSFAKDSKQRKAAMHLIPNLFTTGNLLCGVYAILSVFNGDYLMATIATRSSSRRLRSLSDCSIPSLNSM